MIAIYFGDKIPMLEEKCLPKRKLRWSTVFGILWGVCVCVCV